MSFQLQCFLDSIGGSEVSGFYNAVLTRTADASSAVIVDLCLGCFSSSSMSRQCSVVLLIISYTVMSQREF